MCTYLIITGQQHHQEQVHEKKAKMDSDSEHDTQSDEVVSDVEEKDLIKKNADEKKSRRSRDPVSFERADSPIDLCSEEEDKLSRTSKEEKGRRGI